jgi:hypothetical protein
MGHPDPLVASSPSCMAKHLVRIRICKKLSKRKNELSRIYLATAEI